MLSAHHRSEEHTSELQSHDNLVCRLLLEKKKRDGGEPAVAHSGQTGAARQPGPTRLRPAPARGRPPFAALPRRRLSQASCFFFFNDTATPEIYPLPLHDALRINDTATTEIYPLSLQTLFRSRWSPYHSTTSGAPRVVAGAGRSRPALRPLSP